MSVRPGHVIFADNEYEKQGLDKANGSGQHKLVGGPLEMTAGGPMGQPQTSVLQTNDTYILHIGPPIICFGPVKFYLTGPKGPPII